MLETNSFLCGAHVVVDFNEFSPFIRLLLIVPSIFVLKRWPKIEWELLPVCPVSIIVVKVPRDNPKFNYGITKVPRVKTRQTQIDRTVVSDAYARRAAINLSSGNIMSPWAFEYVTTIRHRPCRKRRVLAIRYLY